MSCYFPNWPVGENIDSVFAEKTLIKWKCLNVTTISSAPTVVIVSSISIRAITTLF